MAVEEPLAKEQVDRPSASGGMTRGVDRHLRSLVITIFNATFRSLVFRRVPGLHPDRTTVPRDSRARPRVVRSGKLRYSRHKTLNTVGVSTMQ